ncbi:MAG: hypothetical protein IJA02_03850 [Clostridia bacterium]|nr:hypothetical protein [Clostridia bacterium]
MKKFIAMLLAAVVLFSCTFGVVAAEADSKVVPVVIVRGMDFGGLIIDQGTENERPALSVEAGLIVLGVFKALFMGLFGGMDGLVDGVIDIVGGIFAPLACDANGNTIEKITVKEFPKAMSNYPEEVASYRSEGTDSEPGVVATACDIYGADKVYYVTYDWRLDPYETAKKINDRVNLALKEHKADKVDIICCSLGGVMTQAYFDAFGYEKVDSCLFLSSAIYGSYCSSDPYAGKVGFDKEILYNFLNTTLSDMGWLWTMLDMMGITDSLLSFANNLAEDYKEEIYAQVMRETFGTWPGLWGMQQTEDYEAAKVTIFGNETAKYAKLIEKMDRYQNYRLKRDDFLRGMQADGVKISLIASYNKPAIPAFERSYVNSDQVLETELMSAGATVAPFGKTLGDDYVAADPAKLSPDRVIDASTCLFPDNTWFIKDAPHVCCRYGSQVAELVFWLIGSETQPTVNDNIRYPQFTLADAQQNLYRY